MVLPYNPNASVRQLTGSSIIGVLIIDFSVSLLTAFLLKVIVDHVWHSEGMQTVWAFNFRGLLSIIVIVVMILLLQWAVTIL